MEATQLSLMPDEVRPVVNVGKPHCPECGSEAVVVVGALTVCVVCPAGAIQRALAQDLLQRQRYAITRAQARGRSPWRRRR